MSCWPPIAKKLGSNRMGRHHAAMEELAVRNEEDR